MKAITVIVKTTIHWHHSVYLVSSHQPHKVGVTIQCSHLTGENTEIQEGRDGSLRPHLALSLLGAGGGGTLFLCPNTSTLS